MTNYWYLVNTAEQSHHDISDNVYNLQATVDSLHPTPYSTSEGLVPCALK